MILKEFEERIGKPAFSEAYATIGKRYMNANLNKDEFCELYMKTLEALLATFDVTRDESLL